MPSPKSLIDAAANLWGVLQQPKYDAIVVGYVRASIVQKIDDRATQIDTNLDLFSLLYTALERQAVS